jgi:DNA-binding NarL/FixJ family response regulator
MTIQHIKTSWPDIRCLVLVNDDEGRQKVLGTGADLIVIKGLPGVKLVAQIKKLLHPERLDHPMDNDSESETHNQG